MRYLYTEYTKMGWLGDYSEAKNIPMTIKHFYYNETIPDKRGNILTACGIHVSLKYETDCNNPTCTICKQRQEEYEKLRIE